MSQTKTKVHPITSKLNQRGVVLFNSDSKITQITDPAIKLLFGTELSDKDIYTNDTYSEKLIGAITVNVNAYDARPKNKIFPLDVAIDNGTVPAVSLKLENKQTALLIFPELIPISNSTENYLIMRRLCKALKPLPDLIRYHSAEPEKFPSTRTKYVENLSDTTVMNKILNVTKEYFHAAHGMKYFDNSIYSENHGSGSDSTVTHSDSEISDHQFFQHDILFRDNTNISEARFISTMLTAVYMASCDNTSKAMDMWFEEDTETVSAYIPVTQSFSKDTLPFLISELMLRALGARAAIVGIPARRCLKIELSRKGDYLYEIRRRKHRFAISTHFVQLPIHIPTTHKRTHHEFKPHILRNHVSRGRDSKNPPAPLSCIR